MVMKNTTIHIKPKSQTGKALTTLHVNIDTIWAKASSSIDHEEKMDPYYIFNMKLRN